MIESAAPSASFAEPRDEVDAGPLAWLIEDIRDAFEKSLGALNEFGSDMANEGLLRVAASHLHQAHGALQIIDLEGVTLITEELERLYDEIAKSPSLANAETIELVADAFRAVQAYLSELLSGASHRPLLLYPQYEALRKRRKADRIHPADLLFPDLAIRPPRPARPGARLDPELVAAERARFERGLLRLLRGDAGIEARGDMRAAVAVVDGLAKEGRQRAFWWVVHALFEALEQGAVTPDLNVKRLAARVNLQMRRLLDGSATISERLLRDALYFVASASPVSERLREAQRIYSLRRLVPDADEIAQFGRLDNRALTATREALLRVKTAWTALAGAEAGAFAGASSVNDAMRAIQGLRTAAQPLKIVGIDQIAGTVEHLVRHLAGVKPLVPPAPQVGLDVATALLFLENGLERAGALNKEFDARAALIVERLRSTGASAAERADVAWLDEYAREAQERLSTAAFVAEMNANLAGVEKILDGYFRDPRERAELPEAERLLAQMGGALLVLGHEAAGRAVAHGREQIRSFVASASATGQQVGEYEKLAQNLGALGFFLDGLVHRGRGSVTFSFDDTQGDFIMRAAPVRVAEEEVVEVEREVSDELTVEQELAGRGAEAQALADRLIAGDGGSGIVDSLAMMLQNIQQDAVLLDDSGLRDGAARLVKQLQGTRSPGALTEAVVSEVQAAVRTLVGQLPQPKPRTVQAVVDQAPTESVPQEFGMQEIAPQAVAPQVTEAEEPTPDDSGVLEFPDFTAEISTPSDVPLEGPAIPVVADLNVSAAARGDASLDATEDIAADPASALDLTALSPVVPPAVTTDAPSESSAEALVADFAPAMATDEIPESDASALETGAEAAPAQVDVDPELLEIFLAEADEVLEEGRRALQVLVSNPDAQEELKNMRRVFHTLKGSGRMVGLEELGAAAWVIEELLNDCLAVPTPVGSALQNLLESALEEMSGWVGELQRDGHSSRSAQTLWAAVDGLHESRVSIESSDAVVGAPSVIETATDAAPDDISHPESTEPGFDVSERTSDELDFAIGGNEPVAEGTLSTTAVHLPPLTLSTQPPTLPDAGVEVHPDEMRRIGSLQMSAALYNIYMLEADELLRVLVQDFGEWRHELDRSVSESALRAVHSLRGSSGTIGLMSVRELAFALEKVLLALQRSGGAVQLSDIETLEDGLEGLRAMLHRFAAEIEPAADVERVRRAEVLCGEIASRPTIERVMSQDGSVGVADAEAGVPIEEFSAEEGIVEEAAVEEAVAEEAVAEEVVVEEAAVEEAVVEEAVVEEAVVEEAVVEEAVVEEAVVQEVPAEEALPAEFAEPADFVPSADPSEFADAEQSDAVITEATSSAGPQALDALTMASAVANDAGMRQRARTQVKDEIDPDLLQVFVEEAGADLPQLGEALHRWSLEPKDLSPVPGLLRQLHTLKGSARMTGAMNLGEVMHHLETSIESALNLSEIPPVLFDRLLGSYDRAMHLFERLQQPDAAEQAESVVDESAGEVEPIQSVPVDSVGPDDAGLEDDSALSDLAVAATQSELPAGVPGPAASQTARGALIRVRAEVLERLVNDAGEVSIARARLDNEMTQVRTALDELTENVERLRQQLREIEIQAESQLQSRNVMARDADEFDPLEFDRFTRFQELTRMMAESVGDVATVQRGLHRNLENVGRDLAAQERLTRDMQQELMRIRMVQFGSISERLYRTVRRASKELGKRVSLDIRGGGTEIDRSVLERMVGPFEHLLRNSLVHGIEDVEGRRRAGKDEIGQLTIEVRQEGNEIVLMVSDDGAGLNFSRIRERGIAQGLLKTDEIVDDARLADLIFHPGFSTSTEVTELAGRGVGMDVVRVESVSLGGRVRVESTAGRGSRFIINLPLTLAMIQVVLVRVSGRLYAIPSVLVDQVQQLRAQALAEAYGAGRIVWGDAQLPVRFLGELLGEQDPPLAQRFSPLLMLRSGDQRLALHVDEVVGNEESVVKDVGPQLARMAGIAGATVTGSGEIVLILNPLHLVDRRGAALDQGAHREAKTALGTDSAEGSNLSAPKLEVAPVVMVVDDSLTVRRVTERLLLRDGYQVVLARDGVDALERMQDLVPDVMLVDIEMPRMDGFDLTRNVRGDERFRDIPIIMITSRTADKHRNVALSLGVNVYLGKPYNDEDLLGHIAGFVGKRA